MGCGVHATGVVQYRCLACSMGDGDGFMTRGPEFYIRVSYPPDLTSYPRLVKRSLLALEKKALDL